MTYFYLITTFTILSGLLYLIILLIKNFVSRKNMNHALGINFGNYSTSGHKPDFIQYSYIKLPIDRGPDITYFVMCANMPRNFSNFIVVRERFFDKIFKIFDINKELQTGYPWFDKRHYIISEANKTIKKHLLANEQTCKIIADLLAEGFDYIKLDDGVLKVGFSSFTGWRWLRLGVVKRSAELFTQLHEQLEKYHLENKRPKRIKSLSICKNIESFLSIYILPPDKLFKHYPKKWVRQRKFWISSAGYVLFIGLLFMFIGLFFDPYPVIEFEQIFSKGILYLAFPVMFLHLLAAGIHLSGRARSHKELSWIAFLNGIGYPLLAVMMFQLLNGFLDNGPVVSHSSKLIDTDYSRSSKGPDSYYIIVESWKNSDTEKLSVSESFYNLSVKRINKTVNILTKSGAFNVEWLYDYRFDNEMFESKNRWE